MESSLFSDPLLRDVPVREEYKVLDPGILLARIGSGGMGSVYLARHVRTEGPVAIKCLKATLTADGEQLEELIARFKNEARLAASISSPHLVQVQDVRHDCGLHYIVMEFVRGESARGRLKRKGRLTVDEALSILHGAAKGLAAAHENQVVHRDVKPDNILIATDGVVKVADLGLAKAADGGGPRRTYSHARMGTFGYISPEQIEDSSRVGAATDVWSLGATGFFLLTGKDPGRHFPPADDEGWGAGVPGPVVALLKKCTAEALEARFRDAGAVVAALEPLVNSSASLRDPDAGTHATRVALETPPPQRAMGRIKHWLDSRPRDPNPSPETQVPEGLPTLAPEPRNPGQPIATLPPAVAATEKEPSGVVPDATNVGQTFRSRGILWGLGGAALIVVPVAFAIVKLLPEVSAQELYISAERKFDEQDFRGAEADYQRAYEKDRQSYILNGWQNSMERLILESRAEQNLPEELAWIVKLEAAEEGRGSRPERLADCKKRIADSLGSRWLVTSPDDDWPNVSSRTVTLHVRDERPHDALEVTTLLVNSDHSLRPSDDGFKLDLPLVEEGRQTLAFSARFPDAHRNPHVVEFEALEIVADWSPPDLDVKPQAADKSAPVTLRGTVEDNQSSADAVNLKLILRDHDRTFLVSPDSSGAWETTLRLGNGEYRAQLVAEDRHGNEARRALTVRVQTPIAGVTLHHARNVDDPTGVATVLVDAQRRATLELEAAAALSVTIRADVEQKESLSAVGQYLARQRESGIGASDLPIKLLATATHLEPGQYMATRTAGKFELPLVLPDGLRKLNLELHARDEFGNESDPTTVELRSAEAIFRQPTLLDGGTPGPADVYYTHQTSMTLRGVVHPHSLVSWTVDGDQSGSETAGADGSFSALAELPATDGRFEIVITATIDGDVERDSLTVALIRAAPMLTLKAPPEDAVVHSDRAELRGTVEEPAEVFVKRQPQSPEDRVTLQSGAFAHEVALIEGDNVFEVRAQGPSGLESTRSVRIRYEVVPEPELELLSAATVWTSQDNVELSVRIAPRGSKLLILVGGEVTEELNADEDGRVRWTAPLSEERTQFLLRAENKTGKRSGEVPVTIHRDRTPPLLSVPNPPTSGHHSQTRWVEISGSCTDDSTCVVSVNGDQIKVEPQQPNWSWSVPVAAGPNPVKVQAEDLAGNQAQPLTFTIEVDDRPPVTLPAWAHPVRGATDVTVGSARYYTEVRDRATGMALCLVHGNAPGGSFYMGRREITIEQFSNREDASGEPQVSKTFGEYSSWARQRGFDLPTQQQWEFACAGRTRFGLEGMNEEPFEWVRIKGRATSSQEAYMPGGHSKTRSTSNSRLGARVIRLLKP
ncbi:MAG: protein kinase [Planctomycetota bacterium]